MGKWTGEEYRTFSPLSPAFPLNIGDMSDIGDLSGHQRKLVASPVYQIFCPPAGAPSEPNCMEPAATRKLPPGDPLDSCPWPPGLW